MNVYFVTAAMLTIGMVSGQLARDTEIRRREYTLPLATMPANVDALAREMLAEAAAGKNLTPAQLAQIETSIYKMLGQGAVLQRNHELKKTREKISYFGQFLSWFMKAKGLSYQQIQAKYEKDFSGTEKELHKKIISAASGANKSLFTKFLITLQKKFMPPLTPKL